LGQRVGCVAFAAEIVIAADKAFAGFFGGYDD
jgi:hypothetical protein